MEQCKVIAITNQKGGVGKTTTTLNLGVGLAMQGKRVMLLDADPQGSLTVSLGIKNPDDLPVSLANIMQAVIDDKTIPDRIGILRHDEGVDLLSSNIELSGTEIALFNTMSRENVLRSYLETILSGVKPTLDYLGITLKTDISHSLPTLPLDRVKLRQAILNLLRNAEESISHPHGEILIRAYPVSEGVCISIQDNGCGINAEQLPDIFTPFVTSKSNGSGLGLSVTRQVIKAHGGHIEVESTPGQGSTFRIFLGKVLLG